MIKAARAARKIFIQNGQPNSICFSENTSRTHSVSERTQCNFHWTAHVLYQESRALLGLARLASLRLPHQNWKREWMVGSPETRRPASTLLAQAPTCGPLSHVYGSQSEKQLLRSRLRELLERQVFTPPSLCFHCEKTLGIPFLVEKKRRIPPARLF